MSRTWLIAVLLLPACGGDDILGSGGQPGQNEQPITEEPDDDEPKDTADPSCDLDGDGYLATTCAGIDCDDDDPDVHPDATEHAFDGVDADCDGNTDFHADETALSAGAAAAGWTFSPDLGALGGAVFGADGSGGASTLSLDGAGEVLEERVVAWTTTGVLWGAERLWVDGRALDVVAVEDGLAQRLEVWEEDVRWEEDLRSGEPYAQVDALEQDGALHVLGCGPAGLRYVIASAGARTVGGSHDLAVPVETCAILPSASGLVALGLEPDGQLTRWTLSSTGFDDSLVLASNLTADHLASAAGDDGWYAVAGGSRVTLFSVSGDVRAFAAGGTVEALALEVDGETLALGWTESDGTTRVGVGGFESLNVRALSGAHGTAQIALGFTGSQLAVATFDGTTWSLGRAER